MKFRSLSSIIQIFIGCFLIASGFVLSNMEVVFYTSFIQVTLGSILFLLGTLSILNFFANKIVDHILQKKSSLENEIDTVARALNLTARQLEVFQHELKGSHPNINNIEPYLDTVFNSVKEGEINAQLLSSMLDNKSQTILIEGAAGSKLGAISYDEHKYIYVIDGLVKLDDDGKGEVLSKHDTFDTNPSLSQSIEFIEDSLIIVVLTPPIEVGGAEIK